MFGVTICLFILVITSKQNMCVCITVCVAADEEIDIHTNIFMTHLLTP